MSTCIKRSLQLVMCFIISDRAALRAAKLLGKEPDACCMHDLDNVESSGIGSLVCKDGKGNTVNAFPAGQQLVAKVHALAKHFSYSLRWSELVEKASKTMGKGTFSSARLMLDLNETRVMAKHGLLWSACRANKLLKLHALTDKKGESLSQEEWSAVADIEACMNLSKPVSVSEQTEKHPVAAMVAAFAGLG